VSAANAFGVYEEWSISKFEDYGFLIKLGMTIGEVEDDDVRRHMHHTPSSPTPIGDPDERSECL
jgi:hypothetical protein